jgi:hypothetical protein
MQAPISTFAIKIYEDQHLSPEAQTWLAYRTKHMNTAQLEAEAKRLAVKNAVITYLTHRGSFAAKIEFLSNLDL